MIVGITVLCFGVIGCYKTGEITNYYENEDFKFTQINMPDDSRVWVAVPKKKSSSAVSTSHEYMCGKVMHYDTVVIVSEDGKEQILSKKEIK